LNRKAGLEVIFSEGILGAGLAEICSKKHTCCGGGTELTGAGGEM
jgi:hypothetical protein